jgi:hypothetical protein
LEGHEGRQSSGRRKTKSPVEADGQGGDQPTSTPTDFDAEHNPFPRKERAREGRTLTGPDPRRDQTASEEKVALVGFPFGPTVPAEAHLFRVVGAEFIAEELTAWSAPRL